MAKEKTVINGPDKDEMYKTLLKICYKEQSAVFLIFAIY